MRTDALDSGPKPGALGGIGIRTRISGGSVLIAILISVVAGIVLNAQLERIVREGTVAVLDSDAAPYVVAITDEPGEDFDAPGPGQLVAVLNGSGAVVLDTLPDPVRDRVDSLVDGGTAEGEGTVAGGYIVESTPVEADDGERWHVVAARSIDLEADVLSQMRALLIGGLALIVVGVGVTAWVLTTVSLGPVNRLRASADALGAETLRASASHELLPVGPANDEITRLAVTLNDLIGRLRASADRERQLVSDASHEIRTPLAILRTQLELARREASSIEQLTRDIEGAERSAVRLGALVNSMLALSALESDRAAESATGPELDDEVTAAVERLRYRADGRGIDVRLDMSATAGAPAADDSPADSHAAKAPSADASAPASTESYAVRPEDFGRVIDNLANNALAAVTHRAAASDSITISFARVHGVAELAVADTGPGLSVDFEPHAFERFTREDASRGSDAVGAGSGLGLPIVAAIVHRANGSVSLENSPGLGLTVRVRIPRLES